MTHTLKGPAAAVLAAVLAVGLAVSPAVAKDAHDGRWLKIRVYEKGATTPSVLVNLPMSLVSAVLRVAAKSEAPARLDLEALIKELEAMGPGQVVEVQDEDEKVSIGIE